MFFFYLLFFNSFIFNQITEINFLILKFFNLCLKNFWINLFLFLGQCVYLKRNVDEKHKQLLTDFNRECVRAKKNEKLSPEMDDFSSNSADSDVFSSSQSTYDRSDLRIMRVERLFIGPRCEFSLNFILNLFKNSFFFAVSEALNLFLAAILHILTKLFANLLADFTKTK